MPEQKIHNMDCRAGVMMLEPKSIHCAILDPPYGVDFVSRRAVTPGGKKWAEKIANDGDLDTALELFDEVMELILDEGGCAADEFECYVFTRWDIVGAWIEAVNKLSRFGLKYKMMLIWDKGIPGQGDIDANWGCGHEIILYCKRGRKKLPYRRSGIIAVDKLGPKQHIHPTEKPVQLIEVLLGMSVREGESVLDPFAGSGVTLAAARRLGLEATGFELSTTFYERIQERLSQGSLMDLL